jgi:hypothetical protein
MVAFTGAGEPMSQAGINAAAGALTVGLPEVWSVIAVETSGCGFLPDRRPKILFERHIFSRLTNGRFDADDPDVSQPSPGGYGPSGAHQYERLAAAMLLDQEAALKSASWGLGQVMGENFHVVGFNNVSDMVADMVKSEDNQLKAMSAFIVQTGIAQSLRDHNWAGFARRYNGPNFAANNYDGLLQHFFEIYSANPTPNLQVRAAQVYLTYRGFNPGPIDAVVGTRTTAAVKAFQAKAGLPDTGIIDDALLAALSAPVEQ